MSKFEKFREQLLTGWNNFLNKFDEETEGEMARERIVVFVVAMIVALCLWLLVNLSRDYNLNIEMPISLGAVPEEKALAEDLPEEATVSVTGEGWKLINLYNNPPGINVEVNNAEVNIYDQVQRKMNMMPNISVQKVQPLILTVQLEDRVSKKVPLRSTVSVSFRDQYDFVDPPGLKPDSITVSGARSLVRNIREWSTDSVHIANVSDDISSPVDLKEPGELITISKQQAEFTAQVSQFTEGEAMVDIKTRGFSSDQNVSFSPSSITVKYDVPIDEYTEIQDFNPFRAYVTYEQIQRNSSGFITPQIEQTANNYHIRLRSFQPRRVAYFTVLD